MSNNELNIQAYDLNGAEDSKMFFTTKTDLVTGLDAELNKKVDKISGKDLSTEDYTTVEKNKLAGVETGAQVNKVTSVAGKTGAVTLTKSDVGLSSVDNTSDANKPVSTAAKKYIDELPTRQPNFSEANVTSATWSANIATSEPILGAGWSLTKGSGPTGTYTHETGNTANLSFPVNIVKDNFYEIVFTQTSIDTSRTSNFELRFMTSETASIGGEKVGDNICYDATFVIQAGGNYGFLNVIPATGWEGNFVLKSIKEAVSTNSETLHVKGHHIIQTNNGIIIGSGGKFASSGSISHAFGNKALYCNTSGSDNNAFGNEALRKNASGNFNNAFGRTALWNNAVGSYNNGFGISALYGNVAGSYNSGFGYGVLYGNRTGNSNSAIGEFAFRNIITGSYNVAMGSYAGAKLSNGSLSQTIANNSVFIGTDCKGSVNNNQTNQIVIGYEAIGGGSNTITLGNDQITALRCQVTSITALSDTRTKEYHAPADLQKCYEAVKSLPVSRYKYEKYTGTHIDENVTGWLADDVEKIFPKSVTKLDRYFPVLDENGEQVYETITEDVIKIVDGEEIIKQETKEVPKMFLMEDVKEITMTEALPTLWGAVQMLMKKIEELEGKIS